VRLKDGYCYPPTPAPPFFVFHWANAFESECGRYLYLDAAMYDDAEIVRHLSLDNVSQSRKSHKQLPMSTLRRVTVDLENPTVEASISSLIDDDDSYGSFIEFPCINEQYVGRKHRYVWGTAAIRPTNVNNAIAKFDLETRKCVGLWHEPGGIVGEPRFIPKQADVSYHGLIEDEGVVLAVVILPDGRSALVCLDGATHKEVARSVFPDTVRITNGFHGTFIRKAVA
jgi:carlactone synthase/all-trans-10'-apo-beta-carotenal 13,14-cleaving dioxygenase